MRKLTISLLVFFAVVQSAAAQLEPLSINGPSVVTAGTLVRLSANTADGESPFWIVLDPIDLDYEQVDRGQRILFAASCSNSKRITVLLLAQHVLEGRIVTRQVRRTIKVLSTPSPAEPITQPNRPDTKDSPLYASILNVWSQIKTDAAKDKSLEIASNFDELANRCASGEVQKTATIWTELSRENRLALGVETSAWEPLALVVQTRFKQLGLTSPKEHVLHLKAVAAAIRAAFQKSRVEANQSWKRVRK